MVPPKSPIRYQILETTGRLVYEGQSQTGLLPYERLNEGIYVLRVAYDGVRFSQTVWMGK
jgi:hypothetical protein